jgi:two-component system, response regulator PdtaR
MSIKITCSIFVLHQKNYMLQTELTMNRVKILIVEDQKIIARDIEILLTDWGYQVVGAAATEKEALSIFASEKPDMALVDIQLRGGDDGIKTVEKFNTIRHIPIVYLTAQADALTYDRAKNSHPAAYLLKPFDERSLQISLDLAFDNFAQHQFPSPHAQPVEDVSETDKHETFAHEIKLSSDVILQHNDSIFIKQNYRFVKLKKEDVILIEADRNYSYIYTMQHKHLVRMTLTAVLERLQIEEVIRIHRSFAVHILNVAEFNEAEIIAANGKTIPFSSAYREDFLKHFNVI